jgi:hypothetical protein
MSKDTKRQAMKDREVRLWLMGPMITHCSDKKKSPLYKIAICWPRVIDAGMSGT